MVPEDGLEPSLPKKMDFESIVSTNSTTRALKLYNFLAHFKTNKSLILKELKIKT